MRPLSSGRRMFYLGRVMSSRRRNRQYQEAPPAISNAHYDTGGNLIGGYAPDGTAIGSKRELQSRGRPIGRRAYQQTPMQPQQQPQAPVDPTRTARPAQGAGELQGRQQLFKDMETAGFENLDGSMRERARKLGVDDTAFNTAATRLRTNETYTPKKQAPPAGGGTPPAGGTPPPGSAAPQASQTNSKNPLMPNYKPSMIDGLPASDAIDVARIDADSAVGAARIDAAAPKPGRELAQHNVQTMGMRGALDDFKKRKDAREFKTPPALAGGNY